MFSVVPNVRLVFGVEEDSCEDLVLKSAVGPVSEKVLCVLSGLVKEEVAAKGDDDGVTEKGLGI